MSANPLNVFSVEEERIFKTTLTVPKRGYYRVQIRYSHHNWDAWLKLEIQGETGEKRTCIPPLPGKYSQTVMEIFLFAGVNQITMAPRFDQPVEIRAMEVMEAVPDRKPQVIPSGDWFYRSDPKPRHLVVVSDTGAPVRITAGEREIPFELEDKALYDHADPVETKEPQNYYHIRLNPEKLAQLEEGTQALTIHLPENRSVCYLLTVENTRRNYGLQIVNLDVNHGNCVLLRLPNGKNMLIDTGTENCAEEVIFPYLEEQGIGIDYLLISHDHGDHMGCLVRILERYPLPKPDSGEAEKYIASAAHEKRAAYLAGFRFLDNKMLCRYDRLDRIWDLGGVEMLVLNSKYESDGTEAIPGCRDENEMSVSMIVRYNGFRYYHGADNHAMNQRRTLEDFTGAGQLSELECQYMQANHHFHGDLLPEMIRAVNPVAVVVPAHQAVYSRSAFMVDYLQDVVQSAYPYKRLKDTFVSYMSGTVCAQVNSAEDWHYETQ